MNARYYWRADTGVLRGPFRDAQSAQVDASRNSDPVERVVVFREHSCSETAPVREWKTWLRGIYE